MHSVPAANLMLKCAHSSLKFKHLHVKSSLLSTEGSYLLLVSGVLLFLGREVSLNIFLDFKEFIRKRFANVLGLHCK